MLGLKPIKLLPARERVASALRKAIISKSIPEGAELTLENTAQELGVSVTPVREAFQILARDGLLEVKQNKCAIVLGVTEKNDPGALPVTRRPGRDGVYALLPEQRRPVQNQKLRGHCRRSLVPPPGGELCRLQPVLPF